MIPFVKECLPPPERYTRPTFRMPAGACDSHSHVTPVGTWKLAPDASYVPAPCPPEAHRRMRSALGLERAVVIQASAFGTDNSGVLDALADEPETVRGVVVVNESISDEALADLHRSGVRGARFITNGLGGTVGFASLKALAPRISSLGWHIELLPDPAHWSELLPILKSLTCPIVLDHMGYLPASVGLDDRAMRVISDLVIDRGAWMKLVGYRLSPDLEDARLIERAHAFYRAAPERMIWGTDWPHLGLATRIDAGKLLNVFASWFDNDAAVLERVLAANPSRLFDFPQG